MFGIEQVGGGEGNNSEVHVLLFSSDFKIPSKIKESC